ncbi:EF-hand domain-containing protein D2 [Cyanistes caeruleus]|nr:EF-hand domain-containing protein D2 [Cyanistes caeruleus]
MDGTGSGQRGWGTWRCHSEEEVVTEQCPVALAPWPVFPCSGCWHRELAAGLAASWQVLLPSTARKQERSWIMLRGVVSGSQLPRGLESCRRPSVHRSLLFLFASQAKESWVCCWEALWGAVWALHPVVMCQDHPVCRYDAGKDGFIDLMELKLMMEKLGAPQTHLGLKNMIKEVDEDLDSKLSFREFLLIFRKAAAGELQEDSGLHALARLSEIDVSTEGVKGAKNFFEAKAQAINEASRFEEEIKAEQEEKKKQAEELKQRKAAFKELQSTFTQ